MNRDCLWFRKIVLEIPSNFDTHIGKFLVAAIGGGITCELKNTFFWVMFEQ
jgi:hypothetical protein